MPRVGYIGFGELGYYQAKGLAGEGVQDIVAFVSAVTTDSGAKLIARVKWVYDSGGREVQRSVLLGGTGSGELVTATAYEIKATATGAQATDGDLVLASTGAKTPADKWR